jgi:hypothetical protein
MLDPNNLIRLRYLVLIGIFFASPLPAIANECWATSNIKGYSAFSNENYKFSKDGISNVVLICFGPDGGTVTGTDVQFTKFGESTLAGYVGSDKGNELFEVYQIDRQNQKLLYVKTRIGTKKIAPILPDIVSSYVGDAKLVE